MKQVITEAQLNGRFARIMSGNAGGDNIDVVLSEALGTAASRILSEGVGVPTEDNWYINTMAFRIKSWMEDVYQDYGGLQSVSPEMIKDFSNRDNYEESLDSFSREFGIDRNKLRPLMDRAIDIAYDRLTKEVNSPE